MAITIGNTTTSSVTGGSTTFTHNSNGTYLVLAATVFGSSVAPSLTATYNGVSMTSYYSSADNGFTFSTMYFFSLASPAQGSNSVVVTASGINQVGLAATAISLSGVLSLAGIDSTNGNTSSFTVTPVTVSVNNLALQIIQLQDSVAGAFDGSQTPITNALISGQINHIFAVSYKAISAIGNAPMIYNVSLSNSRNANSSGVVINPTLDTSNSSFLLNMI